jgi:hypothetical protein
MQQPPNLGTLKWAKGHEYPFEILLAVVGENNRGTKQSLVYQACLRAVVEGGLKGAKSIVICSLGPPTKETGRKTVRAMREFLETLEPPLDGEPYHREPCNPRLIFNAATPREMAGANRALEKWRIDLLLTFAKRNPFSILENGLNLLQEGEESSGEEEEGPDPPSSREATGGKSPPANDFFSDLDFGEDFEPPRRRRPIWSPSLSALQLALQ